MDGQMDRWQMMTIGREWINGLLDGCKLAQISLLFFQNSCFQCRVFFQYLWLITDYFLNLYYEEFQTSKNTTVRSTFISNIRAPPYSSSVTHGQTCFRRWMLAPRSSKTRKERRWNHETVSPPGLSCLATSLWEETPLDRKSTLSASQVPRGKHMQAPEQMETPTHHTVTYFIVINN